MSSIFYYEPFYDLDRFFDDWRTTTPSTRRALTDTGDVSTVRNIKPKMDLHEDSQKNLVTATFELPGIKKEDVHIDVNNNRLTVSAESKVSQEHEESGYAVRERRLGKYQRTLQLPMGIKDSDVNASMENGVLNVTFPRVGPEQAPKRITIN